MKVEALHVERRRMALPLGNDLCSTRMLQPVSKSGQRAMTHSALARDIGAVPWRSPKL
jgi:hypothetical protein